MPRIHELSSILLPALVLGLGLAPPASGLTDVEMEISPQIPTWRESVNVTVRGMSGCSIVPGEVSAGFDPGVGPLVSIGLGANCLVSLPPRPFEVEAEVGRLPAATHTVRVTFDDTVLAEEALVVHQVADAVITPPAEPATDAAPFIIGVAIFEGGNCSAPTLGEVTEDAIVLGWPVGCPLLPPETGVLENEVEVGPLPAGDYEIHLLRAEPFAPADPETPLAKDTVHVYDADLCVPSDTALCLHDDRFRVSVDWRDFQDREGPGRTLPLREDTGIFWFFHPDNAELTVKVLDGCGVNGRYWVFVSSGSTVEYEMRVTDTLHDQTRTYRNELRQVPRLLADTTAFATCP